MLLITHPLQMEIRVMNWAKFVSKSGDGTITAITGPFSFTFTETMHNSKYSFRNILSLFRCITKWVGGINSWRSTFR